jgi:hypothetical protein
LQREILFVHLAYQFCSGLVAQAVLAAVFITERFFKGDVTFVRKTAYIELEELLVAAVIPKEIDKDLVIDIRFKK